MSEEEVETVKEKNQEELREYYAERGMVENPGQHFGTDGMFEPTIDKSNSLLVDIVKVFEKHKVTPIIKRRLKSESQTDKVSPVLPYLL